MLKFNNYYTTEIKNLRDLISLLKSNSKNPYPKFFRNLISKIRRRIETSFSQLTSQFNISRVFTKSISGLISRIRIKILAHNLGYFINKCLGNTINIGRIKELVF